jgi:sporulation integral membrane protein YtvI
MGINPRQFRRFAMPSYYQAHKQAIDKIIFAGVLLVFVYIFMKYLFPLTAPFIVGLLLSLAMEPLMSLFTKRFKMGRTVASIICLLVLIIAIGGVGVTIVSKIVSEAKSFIHSIPKHVEELSDILNSIAERFKSINALLPESIRTLFDDPLKSLVPFLTSSLGEGFKSGSWNVVTSVPVALVGLILSFVSALFFMKDKAIIFGWFREKTPKWLSERVSVVKDGMAFGILGYFKAQLIMMSIVGCIVIIGLLIIQYPYALFLGLIIAVIDALPIFGSGSILWPWAAVSFLNGRYFTGVGLLLIYGVVLVTRQTVEPRVLGDQIGIHPLITLMSMYIGIRLFGVLGIIMGPVVAITIKAIFEAKARQTQHHESLA